MSFLTADCVVKSYGARRVLSSATLRAVGGQVCALLGNNGSGKSTLMKIAAGWIAADSGAVRVGDTVLERPRLDDLAWRGVFYLPDHDILLPFMTLQAQMKLFERRFDQRGTDEAAEIARVSDLLDRYPREVSGGELRRAELALALVRKPQCLIADEPYRNIAPVDHDMLTEIFRRMAADGCAVVVSGHEVPSLLAACDQVTWCTDGTTYELGPPAAARKHEAFARGYLGPRYA
jgi:ABC-type multidrug transport system ATPase subunit